MDDFIAQAQANFQRHIKNNSYPGRGLVIGRSANGWVQLYWIMGRSAPSRNRKFVADGGTLRTEPIDPSLVKDPDLIIYEAMLELPGIYLVSNGNQTRTIYEQLQQRGGSFDAALLTRMHEPDAPNYTPRISGLIQAGNSADPVTLSIIKANPILPEASYHFTYHMGLPPLELGYGLTTYQGDGNPLSSFVGEPLLLPCSGSAEAILDAYWQALNAENRIALAVKEITLPLFERKLLICNKVG